ncbi:hypothetical protein EXIGLDRAFT_719495 [Exidia glandulosa HHB12029]|uniref:Uncharacterized protein n=1 Tax=Exidia glandulosa HHB12029 TaxID=1314781 RepID=A0A166BHE5_EXIGL|nr:hypothetical protein EXIGLDRAFT_719495 [Exidia glandulosa HHB12029]
MGARLLKSTRLAVDLRSLVFPLSSVPTPARLTGATRARFAPVRCSHCTMLAARWHDESLPRRAPS